MTHSAPTLLLIRHGESEQNAVGQPAGSSDSPLTERGVRAIEAVGRNLTRFPITQIYSGDLSRSFRSAQILAGFVGCHVNVDCRLNEVHSLAQHDITKATAGIADCLKTIVEREDFACTLIVTHSGTMRIIVEHLLRLPSGYGHLFRRHNAALNVIIKYKDLWRVDVWGKTYENP